MRAYRQRQREGREVLTLTVRTDLIEDMIAEGMLPPHERDNKPKVAAALERLLDAVRYAVTPSSRRRR